MIKIGYHGFMDIFEENSKTYFIFILSFMYDSYVQLLYKLIAYIDEYICRCMPINVQNFVSVLSRLSRVNFA